MFERRVLARNLCELGGILCYVVALANMPIADVTALGQITPLLVMLGASLILGEAIGAVRMALIGLGFAGALMVAQPTAAGISIFALLALGNAVLCAARDLVGRRVAPTVPGVVVALSAALVVLIGARSGTSSSRTGCAPTPGISCFSPAPASFWSAATSCCSWPTASARPTASRPSSTVSRSGR